MKHLKCTSYSPYYRCSHIWTDRDPSRSPGYRFWNLIPLLENMWKTSSSSRFHPLFLRRFPDSLMGSPLFVLPSSGTCPSWQPFQGGSCTSVHVCLP